MPEVSERELERLKRAVEELTTLNRIVSSINVSMSVDKISSTIVDHCRKRVNASQGAIFLMDEEENKEDRFKTFVREISKTEGQIPFHLNNSLQGWMIKNKSILISNDPDNDDRLRGVNFAEIGINSLLAAPLLIRRGLIGLLVLFNKDDEDGFDELDKRFLGIVGTQVTKVIEDARLFEKETKLKQLAKDMSLAKTIQEGFLPNDNITDDNCEIYGFNIPAQEVGGDYYDMIQISDERIFISLGDISGKGIPAALLTGNAQSVLRSQLHRSMEADLPALGDCLNNLICHFTSPEQYITAIFGVLDNSSSTLSYINAGHLPPIILRKDGSVEAPTNSDLVIGVLPNVDYQVHEIKLQPGESVYLYTDGVTEAMNEANEQYGEERLLEFLAKRNGSSIRQVCDEIQADLIEYRGKAEQSDDVTILALSLR